MGLLIVGLIFLAFGIFSFARVSKNFYLEDFWFGSGLLCSVVGGVLAIVIGVCALCEATEAPSDYTRLVETKQMIEYRIDNLDNEDNYMVNGGVYDDIIEYNTEIREYKRFSNNFWVGIMYDDDIAALDLIELEGVK